MADVGASLVLERSKPDAALPSSLSSCPAAHLFRGSPNTALAFVGVYRSGADVGGPRAGIKALWRGVGPTVLRASILTSSQVSVLLRETRREKKARYGHGRGQVHRICRLYEAVS